MNPGEMFAAGALLVSLVALWFQSRQSAREQRAEAARKAEADAEMLVRLARIEERGGAESEKSANFRAATEARLQHISERLDRHETWERGAEGRLSRMEGRA